jgi:Kef-type K+ transport system membrane component KefB/mannitol/fructose-specific phosphotransferase system IIA component (Ntr-type)
MQHLSATEITVMLLALAVLVGTARLLGELARRFRQPAILGELLSGVVLGPTLFGWAWPEAQSTLFPTTGPNALILEGFSSLAIVLFMMVAGLEVDLSLMWKQGMASLKVGIVSTVIPFAIGLGAVALAPELLGREPDASPWVFALFIATAMAISALPVIAKTLMDLDLYRSDIGMVVITAAIFNDLVGWTVFALILGLMNHAGTASDVAWTIAFTMLLAVGMLTLGRSTVRRVIPWLQAHTHGSSAVIGFAVTLSLACAALTEWIGIHAIFGSFLAGVALGTSHHLQERTRTMLDQFVSFVFAPIFFATIGLKVNFITEFNPGLVAIVLVLATIGKLVGALLGARWAGLPTRERWAIGYAMNARGAMEIVLGLLALEAGLISRELFVALVVMALVTSAMSGPLIRAVLRQPAPERLFDVFSRKAFVRNMEARTSREAIDRLAELAAPLISCPAEQIAERVWARESISATGIGNGVAMPHTHLEGLKSPLVVVGLSKGGIDFDAPDGQPAHVILMILTPVGDAASQLDISAALARKFRDPLAARRVMRAKGYVDFLATFKFLGTE